MVTTRPVPHVPPSDQVRFARSATGCSRSWSATASWRTRTCRKRWRSPREHGLEVDEDDVTYFLGRETLIVTKTPGMALWRERLFVLMARNAVRATTFFRLPPERVVELGVQVEI